MNYFQSTIAYNQKYILYYIYIKYINNICILFDYIYKI